jgi:hypothetical protein
MVCVGGGNRQADKGSDQHLSPSVLRERAGGYGWEWADDEDKQDPANSRVVLRRLDAYDGQNLFPFDPYYGLSLRTTDVLDRMAKSRGGRAHSI